MRGAQEPPAVRTPPGVRGKAGLRDDGQPVAVAPLRAQGAHGTAPALVAGRPRGGGTEEAYGEPVQADLPPALGEGRGDQHGEPATGRAGLRARDGLRDPYLLAQRLVAQDDAEAARGFRRIRRPLGARPRRIRPRDAHAPVRGALHEVRVRRARQVQHQIARRVRVRGRRQVRGGGQGDAVAAREQQPRPPPRPTDGLDLAGSPVRCGRGVGQLGDGHAHRERHPAGRTRRSGRGPAPPARYITGNERSTGNEDSLGNERSPATGRSPTTGRSPRRAAPRPPRPPASAAAPPASRRRAPGPAPPAPRPPRQPGGPPPPRAGGSR